MAKVRKNTTVARPIVASRELKIQTLVETGLTNPAIWAAMEIEYPEIIDDSERRYQVAGRAVEYNPQERARVSRAINSVRGLTRKADDEMMELYSATGGEDVRIKTIDEMEMVNRHRFSWGIPALDYIYGETKYVHLSDSLDSKYEQIDKVTRYRDENGILHEDVKKIDKWVSGSWCTGDPMIVRNGETIATRNSYGELIAFNKSEQKIEHGSPEAFISIWGGEPGVGKSRLAITTAKAVNITTKEPILYINGEATEDDFRNWVGVDVDRDLFKVISNEVIPVDVVCQAAYSLRPRLIIIDSVQRLLEWSKGTNSQINSLVVLKNLKKDVRAGKPHIVCISQLNKSGDLAGSRSLAHLPDFVANVTKVDGRDGVFQFECPSKNRGGPAPRGALFRHLEKGVECISTGDNNPGKRPMYKLSQPGPAVAKGLVK